MIEIEKNVPLPPHANTGRGRFAKYPWQEMEIGDSFVYPGATQTARGAVWVANKTRAPKRFVCRKFDGVTRIWRVA